METAILSIDSLVAKEYLAGVEQKVMVKNTYTSQAKYKTIFMCLRVAMLFCLLFILGDLIINYDSFNHTMSDLNTFIIDISVFLLWVMLYIVLLWKINPKKNSVKQTLELTRVLCIMEWAELTFGMIGISYLLFDEENIISSVAAIVLILLISLFRIRGIINIIKHLR